MVVEGEGALNNIRLRRAKEPVVRVENSDGQPVPGAAVSFVLPAHGAGGFFGSGELSLTVTTTQDGLAVARGLKPNRVAGPFQIRVTGSSQGKRAVAAIHQTNVEPVEAASHKKLLAIVAAIAGGAAVVGIIAATRGGQTATTPSAVIGASAAPPPSATTITAGTPNFGPPGQP